MSQINDFFKYLNEVTNIYITQIELKPIRINTNLYITGFRHSFYNIEAHIKHIKSTLVKVSDNEMKLMLNEKPETEMWMDVTLLEPTVVRTALNELRNNFYKLKGYTIAQLEFKPKNDADNLCTQEENIIYEDIKTACKETIAKRKLCAFFKSSFLKRGEINKQTVKHTPTDEEIAEMA